MPKQSTATVTKEKRPRKDKAPKIKSTLKRPLSAFMIFSNKIRDSVRKENPDATFGAVGKTIGNKWREMSDEQKKPYFEKALELKKKYQSEKSKMENGENNSTNKEEVE